MRAPRLDVNSTKCVDRACLPVCPTRPVFVLICPPGPGALTNSTRRTSIKPRGAPPGPVATGRLVWSTLRAGAAGLWKPSRKRKRCF